MIVFRIGKLKWANDRSGKGAELHGGRWNKIGVPCIYAGETRSIALLEYSAHVSLEDIPRALVVTSFRIPDNKIFEVVIADLPGDWSAWPHGTASKAYGSALLQKNLVIKFPSAVIPREFIYVLNPSHPEFGEITIEEVEDLVYDIRVKK